MEEGNVDDTDWLEQLGESEKGEKLEKVGEEEEEIVPIPEPTEKVVSPEIIERTFNNLKKKLLDSNFISSEHLHIPSCKRIYDIIGVLIENDGVWPEGRKTIDGFTINCPIYGFAPMWKCYNECDNWVGGKNLEGVCTRPIEDIDPTIKKVSHNEAMDQEIECRRIQGAKSAKKEE